jgi:hypothetical protein
MIAEYIIKVVPNLSQYKDVLKFQKGRTIRNFSLIWQSS